MHEPEELMRLAIAKCREGIAAGQSPFGCAIARGSHVLSVAHNTVIKSTDITAHAEINALRQGCLAAGSIFLEGGVVASTCEPCPMCMAALHWARVETVYYGATIEDATAAGFNEIPLPAAEMVRVGRDKVQLIPGLFAEECRALFAEWQAQPHRKPY